MTEPSENEELTTTLPLLVPLWLLAILTGVVLTFSTFLGGTLGIAVVGMLSYCIYKMTIAETCTVQVLEAQLLSALVPLLSATSALASAYFPIATIPLNVVLVSIAFPHLLLLLRSSEKMSHLKLLAFASLMLIISPISFSFSAEGPFSVMLPFVTITIFALVVLCTAVFLVREKVSIRALKFAALSLTLVCSTTSAYLYFYAYSRFWRSMVETLTCTLLFGYLDFLQYQMRTRYAKWTECTHWRAFAHVSIKLCAALYVAMWAGIGPTMSALLGDEPLTSVLITNMNLTNVVVFWWLAQLAVFGCYVGAKYGGREKKPVLEAWTSVNTRNAVVISGCVVVLAWIISIACYYIFAHHPRSIPSIVLLTMFGSLCLVLTHFLDIIREIVVLFSGKLALVCLGLAVYGVATLVYLDFTTPDDLSIVNPELGTIYNASIPKIDFDHKIASEMKQNVSSIFWFKEGTADQSGIFERILFPLMRVCWVGIDVFILLTIHFAAVFFEECARRC